jgi:hypothetical protein
LDSNLGLEPAALTEIVLAYSTYIFLFTVNVTNDIPQSIYYFVVEYNNGIHSDVLYLGGVPVPTAWRVLGLRIEEGPPVMEVSCEYIE